MTTIAAELEVLEQARLAGIINQELSEASGTRESRRLSQIAISRLRVECTCIGNLISIF